jgi:NAD-dependent dihydropyrimidine dehydrogenase PreA subunit
MITAAPCVRVILYEGPGAEPLGSQAREALMTRLLEDGFPVSVIRESRSLETPDALESELVLGQFGDNLPSRNNGRVRDVTGQNPDAILDWVRERAFGGDAAPAGRRWKPWFPVIDFNRCTNCMQCLSFCLFDVYGVTTDGRIQVQNESNCKTDCPACSRVCPEVAIMFPKYKAGPINGDEINADDVRREAMKVDISALLGGDIYSMLRDRSAKAKSRFSKERDDERALRERQRCLAKLKDSGGAFEIPHEVLASLPSLDEIQLKAQQARERAAAALAARSQQPPTPDAEGGR